MEIAMVAFGLRYRVLMRAITPWIAESTTRARLMGFWMSIIFPVGQSLPIYHVDYLAARGTIRTPGQWLLCGLFGSKRYYSHACSDECAVEKCHREYRLCLHLLESATPTSSQHMCRFPIWSVTFQHLCHHVVCPCRCDCLHGGTTCPCAWHKVQVLMPRGKAPNPDSRVRYSEIY